MDGITGAQMRMARGYLRWSAADLAARSGVGISTVKRAEAAEGVPAIHRPNLAAIRQALEAGGIEFLADGSGGVRPRERSAEATDARGVQGQQTGTAQLPAGMKPGGMARKPRPAASPIAKRRDICHNANMVASVNGVNKDISGAQVRAARALLGMNREDFGARSGVPARTIDRLENGKGTPRRGTMAAIVAAFEAAGVEFIAENGGGEGVRLRRPTGA